MFRLSGRSAFSQTVASFRSLLRSVFLGMETVSKHQFLADCSIPVEDVHGELVSWLGRTVIMLMPVILLFLPAFGTIAPLLT